MSSKEFQYRKIPLEQLEADSNQPRKDCKVPEHDRLYISIKKNGLLDPLDIYEDEGHHYIIIDGARRHDVLKQLKISPIPCHVYTEKISKWELQYMRLEIQTVRKNWKPMERANALQQIKAGKRFRTNAQLAEFVGMPESTVQASLALRNEKLEYLELMEKHKLDQNYRDEFIRLRPKLRPIRDMGNDDVVDCIFEKAEHKVIPRGKDFRKLKNLFLQAHMHEEPLYEFLKDPDMTIDELEVRAKHSAIVIGGEKFLKDIGKTLARGAKPTDQEFEICMQVYELLGKIVQRHAKKQLASKHPSFHPAHHAP